jgi:hypothetical protein
MTFVSDSGHPGARVTLSATRRVVVAAVGILFALAATGVVANYLAGAHPKKVAGAFLYLRPVLCTISNYRPNQTTEVASTIPSSSPLSASVCAATDPSEINSTARFNDTPNSIVILPYYDNSRRYVLGPADMTGSAIATTRVISTQSSGYEVGLTFTPIGAQEFHHVAAQRYPFYTSDASMTRYKSLEVVELNGTVVSALVIRAASINEITVAGSNAAPLTKRQADGLAGNIDLARRAIRPSG